MEKVRCWWWLEYIMMTVNGVGKRAYGHWMDLFRYAVSI